MRPLPTWDNMRAQGPTELFVGPGAPAHDGEMVTMAPRANNNNIQASTAARRTAKSAKVVARRGPGVSRRAATRAKVRQSRLARNKGT